MAKIWKEERKDHWSKHFDLHAYYGLPGHDISPDNKLVPVWTYFVEVCGFTFKFGSVAQIEVVLEYYSKKIRPSTRQNTTHYAFERDISQRWYERLPQYLLKESKRIKVVKALENALVEFADYKNKFITTKGNASDLSIIKGNFKD